MVTRLAPFFPGSNTSLSLALLLRLTDPQHTRTYTPTDHHHPQSKMRVSFALFALVAAVIMSLSSAFMPPTPRMARQVRRESKAGRGDDDVSCVCVFVPALPFFVSRPANTCLCLGMCVSSH